MSFKYDKDNLFKEFDVAKQKDIALSSFTELGEISSIYLFSSKLVLNS